MFRRRKGTAGICGHLYETKLLSLLYFRAIHDDRITEFQLASNVDDVGAFDDICFKATVDVDGCSKPILVFIQAKHKEQNQQIFKIDLPTYFISYLKIRQHFVPSNKDLLFGGTFDEPECLFVIYTTARDEFSNDLNVQSSIFSILNDLIGTGGTVKQPYNQITKNNVEFLCNIAIKDQMTSLAVQLATFITSKVDFQQILSDNNENMLRYHVILAQEVLKISEIQSNGHRIATFHPGFFDTDDKYLTIFKDTLCMEILKSRKEPTDIHNLLSEFISNPVTAEKLSKLIGTVVTHNNGLLEINKQYAEYFRLQQNQEYVSQLTVDRAVELAAKEILLSQKFSLKVPAAFGNKDITIINKTRIEFLTSKMTYLLDKYKKSKMVTIDESLEKGFLRVNAGIAGAIGNLFVLDDNTKLMKITDNSDALGTDAKNLYGSLNKAIELINKSRSIDKIPDLCEYKFYFKSYKFPKLLFEFGEHEENLAKDFLKKLIIYSNQANEKSVEIKLKDEIEENLEYSVYIQAKTNAMFLKYHNEIQTWWMLPKQAPYLTKTNQIFERATSYIIEDPLMTSISAPYVKKIKQYKYKFTEHAVRSLKLQDQRSTTLIIAENSVLTILKVMQHLKNKDHVVLDIEDIVNLTTKERNALRGELTHTNKEKVLMLVCHKIPKSGIEKKTLENFAEAARNKKTIIITNDSSVQIIQTYFETYNNIVKICDEKYCLIDFNEESQRVILESGKVNFQGIVVGLEDLVSGWPQEGPTVVS